MKFRTVTVFGLLASFSFFAAAQSIKPPKEIHLNTSDLGVRNPFPGIESRSVMTDTTWLVFIEIEAGSTSAHHNHADEQTMLVHSGRVRATVEDREYELVAGDVLIIPSYVPHQMLAIEDSTWTEVHGPGFNNSRKFVTGN